MVATLIIEGGVSVLKINNKVRVILLILLVLLISGACAASYHYILGNIRHQEKEDVLQDIRRVQYIISDSSDNLNVICADFSAWDDTLEFVKKPSKKYVLENLNYDSLENSRINMFAVLDNFDKLKYIKVYDSKQRKDIETPREVIDFINKNSRELSQHINVYSVGSGIIYVNGQPMIISFRPITDSKYEAAIGGTLIIGRYIGDSFIDKGEHIIDANLSIEEVRNSSDHHGIFIGNDSRVRILEQDDTLIEINDKNNITGYSIIRGVNNDPIFAIKIHKNRTVYNEGIKSLYFYMLLVVIFAILVFVMCLILLRVHIIKPIENMSREVSNIELNDDKISKIRVKGNDELTQLSIEINNMIRRIEYSNKKIQDSEKQLKLVLEGANAGFWDWDIENNYIYFDEKFLTILGYSQGELPNSSEVWSKIVHEDDLDYSLKCFQNSLGKSVNIHIIEQRVKTKSDDYKWILNQCKVVRYDNDNNPKRMTGIITDITDKKKHEEELRYLNYYDKLTGLFNRGYYEYIIENVNESSSLPISIIIGDLNGLKIANDTFGHAQGDKLLAEAANILKDIAGPNALISRYGGDEFVVILENVDSIKANEICLAIKSECLNRKVGSIYVNIALGCSTKYDASQDINEIIKEAEERMYRNKLLEDRSARNSIISSLTKTLEEKSHETEEHAYRIYNLCVKVGRILNLSTDKLDELYLLARLHDIGKIGIDSKILNKPGKLTDEEWEIMKTHCEIGYRIAASTPDLMHIAYGILTHHERYDGTGYPKGLKGEQIPLLSRLLTIVDAFDVMTHDRPYKTRMTVDEAIEELKICSGKQFDPNLVEICIMAFRS